MADPEVSIKFTADSGNIPPSIDRLKELFDALTQRVEKSDAALQDMSGDVKRVSDAASSMNSTAEATGNADVQEQVNRAFDAGATRVQEYQADMERLGTEMQKLKERAQGVMEAVQEGNMSYDAGLAKMEKMAKFSAKGAASVQKLGAATRKAMEDLGNAQELERALSGWAELSRAITIAQKESNRQKLLLEEMEEQLGQQRLALDKNSAGYEQQVAEIMQAEAALKAYAAQIRTVNEQLSKQQGGLGNAWGTAAKPASTGDVNDAIEKEYEALDKLMQKASAVESRMELDSQKRAAAEEKAAARAEAAAKREAAAKEKAAEKAESAAEKAAAAAQKENAAQEAAAYAMQLAAMSKNKLVAETRRLIAERKKAAAAGDDAAYKRLTAQLGQCRTAMRGLVQAAQMNKIALLQQAQTAAQMGGQISSLAGQVSNFGTSMREGSADVVGMATSITSMGMAMKSALGPIGWVLMAIQGLQMAWNAYAQRLKRIAEARKAAAKAEVEALERAYKRAEEIAERNKKRAWESVAAEEEALRVKAAIRKRNLDLEEAQNRVRGESELDIAKANADGERSILEKQLQMGLISQQDYYAKVSKLDDDLTDLALKNAEEKQKFDEKRARENVNNAQEALNNASKESKNFDERYSDTVKKLAKDAEFNKKFDDIKQGLEDMKQRNEKLHDQLNTFHKLKEAKLEWKDILKSMPDLEQYGNDLREALDTLRARVKRGDKQYNEALQNLLDVTGLTQEELSSYMAYRKGSKEYAEKLQEANENWADAHNNESIVEANRELLDTQKEINRNAREFRNKERELRERQLRIEKELERVMRTGSLEEQKKALQELRKNVVSGSDAWEKYTAQIRSINQKMREERLSELARTAGPDAVMAELERLRAHCKEGSEAWKRYTAQMQKLEVQSIRDELKEYERQLEISTTYQKQDSRTQAEIYRADRKRLADLAAYISRSMAATDDYALRKELQGKLRQTVEQQNNLRATVAKSAQAALKELTQRANEQELEAKNARSKRALENARRRYERSVTQAGRELLLTAKATSADDRKAHARAAMKYQRAAEKAARSMERYTKNPADVRKQRDADRQNFETVREGIRSKRQRIIDEKKGAQKEKQASDSLTKAKKQQAQAVDSQNRTLATDTRTATTSATTAAESARQVTAQLQTLQTKEQELGSAITSLLGTVGELLPLVSTLTTAVSNQTGKTRNEISNLQRQIDFILKRI